MKQYNSSLLAACAFAVVFHFNPTKAGDSHLLPSVNDNCNMSAPIEAIDCSIFIGRPSFSEAQASCLSVTGFSARNFAGSGIYCPDDRPGDTRYGPDRYTHTAWQGELRYELMPRRAALREGSAGGNDDQWVLLRVFRTRRDQWVGVPIYVTRVTIDGGADLIKDATVSLPIEEMKWVGLSERQLGDVDFSVDPTEPELTIAAKNVTESYFAALYTLRNLKMGEIDKCAALSCWQLIHPLLSSSAIEKPEACSSWQEFIIYAQSLDELGEHSKAARMYKTSHDGLRTCIEAMATQGTPVSRFKRWKLSELQGLMARSYTYAGNIEAAIKAVLAGLASSPEEHQRRLLFTDLGDLRLVAGEWDTARASYQNARGAVRTKYGEEESESSFLGNVAEGSKGVGAILIDMFPGASSHFDVFSFEDHSEGPRGTLVDQPSFSTTRSKLLLKLDRGPEWEKLLFNLKKRPWLDL